MVPPQRPAGKWPSHKELHARKCFALGITEPSKVARLWEEERAKTAADKKVAAGKRFRSSREKRKA